MEIVLVGDVMLGRLVNEALKTNPPHYPWGDTLPIFKNAHLRICNLECVISDVGAPWSIPPKVFHYRTDEKNIQTLLAAEIDMVSLANNHILDYEYEGLSRMLKILAENAISFAGAGLNFGLAKKPAISRVDSRKVGLIAFTDNEPDWEARKDKPGIFYVPIAEKIQKARYLFKLIQKTRQDVNILIVSAHWGPNWGYTPPKEHTPFAHQLVACGADIVFGHSGHVFRGIEIYRKKAIFYCTGDFIDDYAVDEIERNDESFIFSVEVDGQKISHVRLYPTIIANFQAKKAGETYGPTIALKMQKLCASFGTATKWDAKQNRLEITI